MDPLLNASPSFGSIHLINSTPQVKFPSLPSSPPPPSPLYRPPPQCLTFIRINTFDQFCPPGKILCRPSAPPSLPPPSPPSPLPPPLQCLTFIGINTFDQFHPQVKFPSAPSAPPSLPSAASSRPFLPPSILPARPPSPLPPAFLRRPLPPLPPAPPALPPFHLPGGETGREDIGLGYIIGYMYIYIYIYICGIYI